jgi:hypothetical protein
MMKQRAADIARIITTTRPSPLTTTRPTSEMLAEAGFAADAPCNAPLQLGAGVPGGAEQLTAACRVYVESTPDAAILLDDTANGFNAISRASVFRGLRR